LGRFALARGLVAARLGLVDAAFFYDQVNEGDKRWRLLGGLGALKNTLGLQNSGTTDLRMGRSLDLTLLCCDA
jgi:hypothetical protein